RGSLPACRGSQDGLPPPEGSPLRPCHLSSSLLCVSLPVGLSWRLSQPLLFSVLPFFELMYIGRGLHAGFGFAWASGCQTARATDCFPPLLPVLGSRDAPSPHQSTDVASGVLALA